MYLHFHVTYLLRLIYGSSLIIVIYKFLTLRWCQLEFEDQVFILLKLLHDDGIMNLIWNFHNTTVIILHFWLHTKNSIYIYKLSICYPCKTSVKCHLFMRFTFCLIKFGINWYYITQFYILFDLLDFLVKNVWNLHHNNIGISCTFIFFSYSLSHLLSFCCHILCLPFLQPHTVIE